MEYKLDYSLESPQERNILVHKIIDNASPEQLTSKYLEILADYLIFAMDKEERKQKNILTENHMVTVRKRETSFQGLAEKLENGEDGIYTLIANDKNILFTPKISITPQDLKDIPELAELRKAIESVEEQAKKATGKKKYLLKKQAIAMRQDQYIIKSAYHPQTYYTNAVKSLHKMDLREKITVSGEPGFETVKSDCIINFFEPSHISALLCNYSTLKESAWGDFENDLYYLMESLDDLVDKTLKDKYPLYYDLLIYKIDGRQNTEIQALLHQKYGIKHSVEYISSLWRKKIPKLCAETAIREYLVWYYTYQERGRWKRCSRCGQIKLAHNIFFSKNGTSKDGLYSICKECRNAKKRKGK